MNGFNFNFLKIAEIYSRKGDDGWSGLAGEGYRRRKDDDIFQAIGSIDELSSLLGLIVSALSYQPGIPFSVTYKSQLIEVQSRLLDINVFLVTPRKLRRESPQIPLLNDQDILDLESAIDTMKAMLEPPEELILPGGSVLGAQIHQARSVCRRAERNCVSTLLQSNGSSYIYNKKCMAYLNRLSDYLFVLSRVINKNLATPENKWERKNG